MSQIKNLLNQNKLRYRTSKVKICKSIAIKQKDRQRTTRRPLFKRRIAEETRAKNNQTEQDVGGFEDKERVKNKENDLPEEESLNLIKKGVRADELNMAT